jgi:hypothetical protein
MSNSLFLNNREFTEFLIMIQCVERATKTGKDEKFPVTCREQGMGPFVRKRTGRKLADVSMRKPPCDGEFSDQLARHAAETIARPPFTLWKAFGTVHATT